MEMVNNITGKLLLNESIVFLRFSSMEQKHNFRNKYVESNRPAVPFCVKRTRFLKSPPTHLNKDGAVVLCRFRYIVGKIRPWSTG